MTVLCGLKLENVKYVGVDQYDTHKFRLSETQYKKLFERFSEKVNEGCSVPFVTFEFSGKTYYTLKIKSDRVQGKPKKNKLMDAKVVFFSWSYEDKQGISAKIDKYDYVKTTDEDEEKDIVFEDL